MFIKFFYALSQHYAYSKIPKVLRTVRKDQNSFFKSMKFRFYLQKLKTPGQVLFLGVSTFQVKDLFYFLYFFFVFFFSFFLGTAFLFLDVLKQFFLYAINH